MTMAEAQLLTAKIAAAFPREWAYAGKATNAVYVERLARLPLFAACQEAIDSLIDTETKLPTISKIREEYARFADRHQPRQLEEPPPSPQARRENLARLRAMMSAIGKPLPEEPS